MIRKLIDPAVRQGGVTPYARSVGLAGLRRRKEIVFAP